MYDASMKRWILAMFCCLSTSLHAFTAVTWNIRRGVGMDEKFDLERTVAVIREQKADVVVLQEVDQGTARSNKRKLADEIAKALGWQVFFGKAIDFQGGEYGQAILSPHPLRHTRVIRLSDQGEARIAVVAELEVKKEWVTVVGVHLDSGGGPRRQEEGKALLAGLADAKGKIYAAGDWNESPEAGVGELMKAAGWIYQKKNGSPFTWPEPKPEVEIDFFWTKGVAEPAESRVIDVKGGSDHRGVIAIWP
jgi:endonuclease/exonuclease/phosphatase family metal-dependent hydrolase